MLFHHLQEIHHWLSPPGGEQAQADAAGTFLEAGSGLLHPHQRCHVNSLDWRRCHENLTWTRLAQQWNHVNLTLCYPRMWCHSHLSSAARSHIVELTRAHNSMLIDQLRVNQQCDVRRSLCHIYPRTLVPLNRKHKEEAPFRRKT